MRKKIEILEYKGQNIIVVDGEGFDWGFDEESFKAAQVISKNDPEVKNNFIGQIQKHFIESISTFLDKKVTLKEVNEALAQGFIEL